MKHTRNLALLVALLTPAAPAARLKELMSIEGVRDNPLIGYGLIVGLAGTGDRRQTVFSAQSLTNLLQRMGLSVPPAALQVKNTAAVMVTANLPPFAQPGSRIDVTTAAIGDTSSLQGGILLLTSVRASDGQVYAVAQGAVVLGGFRAGAQGSNQVLNHPTTGRVPGGALVERAAPSVPLGPRLRLQLRQPDFTTAQRVAVTVNKQFGSQEAPVAHADNGGTITVNIPPGYASRPTDFIADMERLSVEADRTARVVVNERTGTIVMGKEVRISPVAILHGNLSVEIQTNYVVSQPAPLSQGTTTVVPQVGVGVQEEKARNLILKQGATIEELVRGLNAIGSTPRDIVAILQALREAGALEAELEVM